MLPSEIKVGKRYKNLVSPGTVYLGIGKEIWVDSFNSHIFSDLALVVVEASGTDMVGYIVKTRGENGTFEKFWDCFVET